MLKPLIFVVSAGTRADLLLRIALLFDRLHIPVERLAMNRIDCDRTRFTIEVLAEPERSDRIIGHLAKIIYVQPVTQDMREESPAPIRRRRRRWLSR
ncbi:MAG TPA: hypothetical protein VFI45_02925 [Candidatus Acidoferrum sp.]|nr:hypothetical protein [Candidatus Acidoferrum sp.]